jgi:hypothetical protein
MQTFLSEPTFKRCAQALDNKRLNKQLLECRQILNILINFPDTASWRNHPAVLQWKEYIPALFKYAEHVRNECVKRGIRTEKNWKVIQEFYRSYNKGSRKKVTRPYWWYKDITNQLEFNYKYRVITTHRARLYHKDPVEYKRYKKFAKLALPLICCAKCKYFWPTHDF